jgi:membrane protease YdiL (CAAX protease family)
MASGPAPLDSPVPSGEAPGSSSFQSRVRWVFLGPGGIRAGWRMLIFFAVFVVFARIVQAGLKHIPPLERWRQAQPKGVFTPGAVLLGEGLASLSVIFAAFVMTFIEKRSFADYGLPGKEAFGKPFWQGVPFGFAMLTVLMALIAAFHGFSLGGLAIGGAEAVRDGLVYFAAFILVGIFEEFSFRGYLQATLASGIGFWAAAILLAILFGCLHLGNPGEAKVGAFSAGSFGLLAAFALWRTGSLWFPIGMHAAWDWGETFFYSVPDSGGVAQGHFLNSVFHGSNWLTGGSVGPEGSLFVFVALVLGAAAIHFLFPARQKSI